MTWFKVDDSFYDHPKVFDAPDCAVALWTRAGAWSARNLTDGFVPAALPARLSEDASRAVAELVRRGLWSKTSGGYRFHDWPEYQPSKQDVQEQRKRHAEAQARYRQKRQRDSPGDRRVIDHQAISDSAPTRPDPPPKGGEGRRRATPAARADPAAAKPWASSPCPHGQPGGWQLNQASGEALCPLCRRESEQLDAAS